MIENITIGQIVAGLGILTIIIGFIKLIASFIKTHYTDVIDNIKNNHNELKDRVDTLEEKSKNQDDEMKDSKEERLLLMGGVLACLKTLDKQGDNEYVNKSITKLEDYMTKKSHS